MAEYVEKEAVFEKLEQEGCDCEFMRTLLDFPAADVAPVVKELRPAVRLLHKEYEKAKRNPIVRDPLAYALYQVWKAMNGKNGRGCNDSQESY